jgi:hypothetical protein
VKNTILLLLVWLATAGGVIAQEKQASPPKQKVEIADDGVPVIVKHLPEWETAQTRAAVATNLEELQRVAGNKTALSAVEFIAGTEAVAADYGNSKLVLVEFPTPQGATDADQKITAKIAETGQAAPQTVYRKVGNYAVFVFDAPDEATANSLIEKVAYEKEIQWLSDNPFDLRQAQREFNIKTSDIVVTVFKSAGIALVAAIVLGGCFGAFIFFRRRQQQTDADIFTDAGGMMRLNLDELTPQTDPSRLLNK